MNDQDDFLGLFAPEPDKVGTRAALPVWKVLLVDDEPDIHAALHMALSDVVVNGRSLQILDAVSANEARLRLEQHPDIALILLDVVMESEQAGLELVRHVRERLGKRNIQIILVTGQPGYAPQRQVVQDYEIDGYRLKSELTTDKIFVSVFAALRTHQAMLAKESALEETRRFLNAMDRVSSYIYLKDREHCYVYANQITLELFGRTAKSLVGCNDAEFFPPKAVQHLREIDDRVLGGAENQEEVAVEQADGSRRIYWEVKSPLYDDGGNIWGLCGVSTDITERKHMEEELVRHRQHLESLVAQRTNALEDANESLQNTLFAMDRVGIGVAWNDVRDGRFLYANQEACRQLGYTWEELKALRILDVNLEFPTAALDQLARDMRESGKPFRVETLHRRKDASFYPVEITTYLHRNPDHDWFIAFYNDISLRKQFEAELIQARDAAEAANRAKSSFLANMSHELRTPMNAIMGMTGMALRHATDARLKGQLEKVEQASQHLLSVINDILDISKIEAEKLTLEQVSFRLGTLHENLTSLIGHKVAEKGLNLVIDLPEDLARQAFVGDPLHLTQILVNLAGNAVKFTERGRITLRVRVEEDNWSGVLLRYEVEDTGIGVAPQDQPRLFTAFEQADGSMTRRYGGTGLGLAISKRLAALMGGAIGMHSEPGRGSTFWFTVRLSKTVTSPEAIQTPAATAAETEIRQRFTGTRILLAEDEPINQEVSTELLADVGLNVDLAENGREAVDMASRTPYALVLMDMQMPEMNGIDATRAIRRLPGYGTVPILAMTANAFAEDRQACLQAGMNDHVPKPIDPDQMFDVILEWLTTGSRP